MGARRLWALIDGLPDDAAVWRSVGWARPGWSRQDEMTAQLTELTHELGRVTIYWQQVIAAGHGRVYQDMKPQVPPPLFSRVQHPDRPKAEAPPGDGAVTDRDLPPVLTPALARSVGLL